MKKQIVVIKVGTSTVIRREDDGSEHLNQEAFFEIGRQVRNLIKADSGVVIVSSAAIGGGMLATGLTERPARDGEIPKLQRLASIGWRHILNAWDAAIGDDYHVAEMLLTGHSLSLTRHEREEAIRLIHTLLEHNDIPVINENDAIAHQEIAFGDNDTLAATIAAKIEASNLFTCPVKLVLLSDINGVYEDKDDPTTIIREIAAIAEFRHVIGDAATKYGTGGMTTKFKAAETATKAGVDMWICNGNAKNAIIDALAGRTGTHFKS